MPIKHEPTPEHTSQIILRAVTEHERKLGIGTLALVLKGSKDKRVFGRELYTSHFFGALFYHPIDVLENFIKQLIQMDFIKTGDFGVGVYPAPVLCITSAGKEALEKNMDISLQVVRSFKPDHLSDSVRETLTLFRQVRTISAVAQQRKLTESTIWGHLTTAVKFGMLQPSDVVDASKVKLINETYLRLKTQGLKELKLALPERVSYDEIRCVLAMYG